jgi:hypothetical protein
LVLLTACPKSASKFTEKSRSKPTAAKSLPDGFYVSKGPKSRSVVIDQASGKTHLLDWYSELAIQGNLKSLDGHILFDLENYYHYEYTTTETASGLSVHRTGNELNLKTKLWIAVDDTYVLDRIDAVGFVEAIGTEYVAQQLSESTLGSTNATRVDKFFSELGGKENILKETYATLVDAAKKTSTVEVPVPAQKPVAVVPKSEPAVSTESEDSKKTAEKVLVAPGLAEVNADTLSAKLTQKIKNVPLTIDFKELDNALEVTAAATQAGPGKEAFIRELIEAVHAEYAKTVSSKVVSTFSYAATTMAKGLRATKINDIPFAVRAKEYLQREFSADFDIAKLDSLKVYVGDISFLESLSDVVGFKGAKAKALYVVPASVVHQYLVPTITIDLKKITTYRGTAPAIAVPARFVKVGRINQDLFSEALLDTFGTSDVLLVSKTALDSAPTDDKKMISVFVREFSRALNFWKDASEFAPVARARDMARIVNDLNTTQEPKREFESFIKSFAYDDYAKNFVANASPKMPDAKVKALEDAAYDSFIQAWNVSYATINPYLRLKTNQTAFEFQVRYLKKQHTLDLEDVYEAMITLISEEFFGRTPGTVTLENGQEISAAIPNPPYLWKYVSELFHKA